ncbi:MAG: threonine/serine exporter family protein [Negativicutes bacterium]|nr:threonine/serine exporter family protein [Negativicutes bacterium]
MNDIQAELYTGSEPSAAIHLYMHLARLLFQNGATVQHIIDTVQAVRNHLGGDDVQVLVGYGGIVITDFAGVRYHTRVERRQAFIRFNVGLLTAVSRLVRGLPDTKLTAGEIRRRLQEIETRPPWLSPGWQVLVTGLVALGFGGVNGADWRALSGAFPAALLLAVIRQRLTDRGYNPFLAVLVAGLAGALAAGAMGSLIATSTPLIALIAVLLPLVPGFPLINAGVDVMHNHNEVGVGRLAFAVMMLTSLALAACLPLTVFARIQPPPPVMLTTVTDRLADGLFAALAAGSLGAAFNVERRHLPILVLIGLLARLARDGLVAGIGWDMALAAFAGAVAASVLSYCLSRPCKFPAVVFATIGVLPMIPGFLIIDGLNGLFLLARLPASAIDYGFLLNTGQTLLRAELIVLALILGVIFPLFWLEGRKPRI